MFTGSMVAIATPMHDDGAVDYESYENLIEFHMHDALYYFRSNSNHPVD